jgi:hypothetical protein
MVTVETSQNGLRSIPSPPKATLMIRMTMALPDDSELDDDTDLNEDSIPDKDQVGVMTSVKVKNGKKKIGIESNACVVSRVCVMDEQDIDDDDNKPDQMPYGLIGYKFEPPHYGETVSMKIHLC